MVTLSYDDANDLQARITDHIRSLDVRRLEELSAGLRTVFFVRNAGPFVGELAFDPSDEASVVPAVLPERGP